MKLHGIEIGFIKFKNKFNQLFPSSKSRFLISVILTAAGSGMRMGGVCKALYPLNGTPCIGYALRAFDACEEVCEIIITTRQEDREALSSYCQTLALKKPVRFVNGGKTRQESVKAAFCACRKDADLVAIHDAARPLIQTESILKIVKDAKRYGAACAAVKIYDTVKRADQNGFITQTVPREDLYAVQTPQVFKSDLYRVSLALAEKDKVSVTDDCALAENANFAVKLTLIDAPNYKLTVPEDAKRISLFLKENCHD